MLVPSAKEWRWALLPRVGYVWIGKLLSKSLKKNHYCPLLGKSNSSSLNLSLLMRKWLVVKKKKRGNCVYFCFNCLKINQIFSDRPGGNNLQYINTSLVFFTGNIRTHLREDAMLETYHPSQSFLQTMNSRWQFSPHCFPIVTPSPGKKKIFTAGDSLLQLPVLSINTHCLGCCSYFSCLLVFHLVK